MTQPSRHFFSGLLCFGICAAGLAQSAAAQDSNLKEANELSAVFACKSETDPMERLACYDAAVGQFEQAQQSGELITVSKSQIEEVERDSFGFSIPSLPKLGELFGGGGKKSESALTKPVSEGAVQSAQADAPASQSVKADIKPAKVEEIAVNIRKVQEFGYKKNRFFLENGQVWEQTSTKRIRIPRASKSDPNVANIRKASLGSFLLQINDSGAAVSVIRVR
ncbi:hypothetical protein [Litorimonas sp.]|jgi:hypothetical protein|uniref:hypothetical protein n=1 Tax=Litorimonas sp. TaxID=1892381 RepID=UPI003A8A98E7